MRNKIKLIIFDVYGPILNGGYPQTSQVLAKKYNRNWKEIYEVLYKKYFNQAAERKITQKEAWIFAVKELKLPISWKELRKIHYDLMSINNGVVNFVLLKIRKYPDIATLLLSKNTRSQLSDAKKKLNMHKSFNYVINTWELGLPKASRETMVYILGKFKLSANEVLYVDDQKENLIEAKKLGIKTILYQDLESFKKEFVKKIG